MALKTEILVSLQSLAVTGKDATWRDKVIGTYAKVSEKPVFTASQVDEVIKSCLH